MFVAREIPAEHKDLIHDVSYDYHGRRMATCSSDQSVKVKIWHYTTLDRFSDALEKPSTWPAILLTVQKWKSQVQDYD